MPVPGQQTQGRLHEEFKGGRGGGRVARQAEDRGVADGAEENRFARFDGHFPEAPFKPMACQGFLNMILFTDRNTARGEEEVGLKPGTDGVVEGLRRVTANP